MQWNLFTLLNPKKMDHITCIKCSKWRQMPAQSSLLVVDSRHVLGLNVSETAVPRISFPCVDWGTSQNVSIPIIIWQPVISCDSNLNPVHVLVRDTQDKGKYDPMISGVSGIFESFEVTSHPLRVTYLENESQAVLDGLLTSHLTLPFVTVAEAVGTGQSWLLPWMTTGQLLIWGFECLPHSRDSLHCPVWPSDSGSAFHRACITSYKLYLSNCQTQSIMADWISAAVKSPHTDPLSISVYLTQPLQLSLLLQNLWLSHFYTNFLS